MVLREVEVQNLGVSDGLYPELLIGVTEVDVVLGLLELGPALGWP